MMTISPSKPDETLSAYRPLAYRIAYRFFGEREIAEDVAQEACIRAYRARHTYNPAYPYERWFRQIVLNVCRGVLRKERHRAGNLPLLHAEGLPDPTGDLWERFLRRRAVEQAQAVLALLPPPDRALLVQVYLLERSREEVARQRGWTPEALRMRLMRLLRHLQCHLEVMEEAEHGERPGH
jgi:RNA polymerase sigma-70 factor (ECF subfamily)